MGHIQQLNALKSFVSPGGQGQRRMGNWREGKSKATETERERRGSLLNGEEGLGLCRSKERGARLEFWMERKDEGWCV